MFLDVKNILTGFERSHVIRYSLQFGLFMEHKCNRKVFFYFFTLLKYDNKIVN